MISDGSLSSERSLAAIPFLDQTNRRDWNNLVSTAERAVKNTPGKLLVCVLVVLEVSVFVFSCVHSECLS